MAKCLILGRQSFQSMACWSYYFVAVVPLQKALYSSIFLMRKMIPFYSYNAFFSVAICKGNIKIWWWARTAGIAAKLTCSMSEWPMLNHFLCSIQHETMLLAAPSGRPKLEAMFNLNFSGALARLGSIQTYCYHFQKHLTNNCFKVPLRQVENMNNINC